MIRDMVREFARSEIEPVAQDYNERGEYPGAIIKKLGGLGLFGMMVPERTAVPAAGAVSYSLALQEIAYSCASVAVTLSVTNLVTEPILNFGTEDQKKRFLLPLASGGHVGAFALTEPEAGSDPSSLKTIRGQEGRHLHSQRHQAVHHERRSTPASSSSSRGRRRRKTGFRRFSCPAGAKGLSIGKEENKMGLRASDTVELVLEECEVPAANMLGKPGMGLQIALNALDSGRIGIASQATGMIAACLHEGVTYARERGSSARPIIRHQAIQNMIADIAVDYDAAALLTWSAASLKDTKAPFTREASIAKLFATEALNRCAYRALQIFGGYGYIRDNKIERLYRDARVTTIYEGTSEVQRMVIARETERGY